ncbi:MAG: hypothetical protein NC124_14935 [Clostridium sp.]|nr:hypothetical protein [Clostridium sp.]
MILFLIAGIIVVWVLLFVVMLPVYFIRKRKNPHDEKNTIKALAIKALAIKALVASIIMVLIMESGLIAMYFDDWIG